jgi:hypothetical protein
MFAPCAPAGDDVERLMLFLVAFVSPGYGLRLALGTPAQFKCSNSVRQGLLPDTVRTRLWVA